MWFKNVVPRILQFQSCERVGRSVSRTEVDNSSQIDVKKMASSSHDMQVFSPIVHQTLLKLQK